MGCYASKPDTVDFTVVLADVPEDQKSNFEAFQSAEDAMEHKDAEGKDLLMAYLSVVKPAKEAVVEHLVFKPNFE